MNRDQQWIHSLQHGHREVLGEIYQKYKKGFLDFAKRYPIGTEEVSDIYQDSIIVLYENIKQGKLDQLKSSIKTYLYAIGKYKIFAYLKAKPFSDKDGLVMDEPKEEMTVFEISTAEERLQQLQRAFGQLGPKCREVLQLFYYEGKKIEDIKKELSYETKDTVKSQKSRCLKQLKEIVRANENG